VGDGSGLTGVGDPTAGSNTWFQYNDSGNLAGNGALAFTKGTKTLEIPQDAKLDINSNGVSIADDNLSFDASSTTFTQTTGGFTFTPANGSNLNINLLGVSDFIIDSSKFILNNNGNVGIGILNPNQLLSVNGSVSIKETTAPASSNNFGKLFVNTSTSNLTFLDDAGVSYDLLQSFSASTSAGGSNTQFQFNDGGIMAGNGALIYDKSNRVLRVANTASLELNTSNLSVADTNINLTGATSAFTGIGSMTFTPGAGTNFNINLSTTGDFAVNENNFYVDSSSYNVGIRESTPNALLHVNGSLLVEGDSQFTGTIFDIDSSDVRFADTNITLDGSSTTFTQTQGGITFAPYNGSNLAVNLLGASDFVVDTNKFVVLDSGNTGIRDASPDALFEVNGTMLVNGTFFRIGALAQGSLLVASSASNITELGKGADNYVLTVNGNRLSLEPDDTGTNVSPGGSNGYLQ